VSHATLVDELRHILVKTPRDTDPNKVFHPRTGKRLLKQCKGNSDKMLIQCSSSAEIYNGRWKKVKTAGPRLPLAYIKCQLEGLHHLIEEPTDTR